MDAHRVSGTAAVSHLEIVTVDGLRMPIDSMLSSEETMMKIFNNEGLATSRMKAD
ncbi:hypothetical protein [Roseateles sp. P5_E11]